jgi:paraquat-inducible protein A
MHNATFENHHSDFIICHECDLLVHPRLSSTASAFKCPRCMSPLAGHTAKGLAGATAAVIAGLLFFWPAIFLPILQLNILGVESTHTMMGAVRVMADSGMVPVALMVLFCSVLAPLLEFLLLAIVLAQVATGRNFLALATLFRVYTRLDSWTMLEVYLIGLLVSVIKLQGMAAVMPGMGMLCFVGVMLANIAIKVSLNYHEVWRKIDSLCNL